MDHSETIQIIARAMERVDGVQALFLGGSYGNGMADAYSDLDFILVTTDGATNQIAQAWRHAVAQTGDIVLWWDRTRVPVLINAITEDWTRTDLMILSPAQIMAHAQSTLKVVFDHPGLYDELQKTAPIAPPNTKAFLSQIEEFIRVLGLLHLVDGRQDYINGVLGVFHLRNLLVELLIDETNAPHRGGALHLNRLITQDQKDVLTSLLSAQATRDAVIKAHLAYANAYLPRARKRADLLGVIWPEQFERATWKKLEAAVGVKKPYH